MWRSEYDEEEYGNLVAVVLDRVRSSTMGGCEES